MAIAPVEFKTVPLEPRSGPDTSVPHTQWTENTYAAQNFWLRERSINTAIIQNDLEDMMSPATQVNWINFGS